MDTMHVHGPALVRRTLTASHATSFRAAAAAVLQVTGGWLPLTGSTRVMVALGPGGNPNWTQRSWAVIAVVLYGTETQVVPMVGLPGPQVVLGIARRRTCWTGFCDPMIIAEDVPATKVLLLIRMPR